MENIESPFVKFDYDKLRNETTMSAIKALYKVFGDNADLLVYDNTTTKELIEQNQAIVQQKMIEALLENKVPDCDMKFLIENFQATIYMLFNGISLQKNRLETEFMARTIGIRDPGTGKFTREYATLGDMFNALEKIRNEQDGDGENNYFIVKK